MIVNLEGLWEDIEFGLLTGIFFLGNLGSCLRWWFWRGLFFGRFFGVAECGAHVTFLIGCLSG